MDLCPVNVRMTAIATVEDGAAFIRTPQLRCRVPHLRSTTFFACFVDEGCGLQFMSLDHLDVGFLGAEQGRKVGGLALRGNDFGGNIYKSISRPHSNFHNVRKFAMLVTYLYAGHRSNRTLGCYFRCLSMEAEDFRSRCRRPESQWQPLRLRTVLLLQWFGDEPGKLEEDEHEHP